MLIIVVKVVAAEINNRLVTLFRLYLYIGIDCKFIYVPMDVNSSLNQLGVIMLAIIVTEYVPEVP